MSQPPKPSAWTADAAALGVRSVCLPRDGGVIAGHHKDRRYSTTGTDLAATFRRERARLKRPDNQADAMRAAIVHQLPVPLVTRG